MHKLLEQHKPDVVAIDPISSLLPGGPDYDIHALVLRIVDFLKLRGTTGFFTALNAADDDRTTATAISSLVDTWFLLRNVESDGERNRILYLLKSRGMAHSNQIREFLLTSSGVRLRDVYLGSGGVLTGSARTAREINDQREATRIRQDEIHRELTAKVALRSLEAQIANLELKKNIRKQELAALSEADKTKQRMKRSGEESMRRSRGISGSEPGRSQKTNGRGGN
jgi:circadian clock protein KaiC